MPQADWRDKETPDERRLRLDYEYDRLTKGKPYYARNMAGEYVLVTPKGPGIEERLESSRKLTAPVRSTTKKKVAPAKSTLAKPESVPTKGLVKAKKATQ